MNYYTLALTSHVVAGAVALVTFWTAGLMRKGTPRHRRVGQVYLCAMLAVIVSGIPLVFAAIGRGEPVKALFLGFLLLLVGNACWSAWRAIRDRRERSRYFGPVYWTLAIATALSGAGISALGIEVGAPILTVFGLVGVFSGYGAWRSWRRAPDDPKWWLKEHYNAMIGNGVATHIAFFGIGLRNALPMIDPQTLQLFAWFAPLSASLVAGWWLNRKYGTRRSVGHADQGNAMLSARG